MRYTEETAAVFDAVDTYIQCLKQHELYQNYQISKAALQNDEEAQMAIKQFNRAKEKFAEIESYGKHTPGYTTQRRDMMKLKRHMDEQESIIHYRQSELALQTELDDVAECLAQTISSEIKVDAGNPFKKSGGGCQHGSCHS